MVIDVRLNLPPERRTCTAATETNVPNRNVHFFKDGERIAQAKSYAFEDRAYDMAAMMIGGQANEGRTGFGIKVRRALSHQVGRPHHSVGAKRDGSRLAGERIVRIVTTFKASAKLVTEPAQ